MQRDGAGTRGPPAGAEALLSGADGSGGSRLRVALFGQFGMGNIGNEASLEAMLRMLRDRMPHAGVAVICSGPEGTAARFGVPAVAWTRPPIRNRHLRRVNEALLRIPYKIVGPFRAGRIMRRFDVLLVPGTGLLDDFGERAAGGPYTILKWVAAARLVGCKVAMASIGAGPIHSRASRMLMMAAARLSHHLTFRDAASRDFVVRHGGCGAGMVVYPDLAFALPAPEPPAPVAPGAGPIALGVMRYRGWTNSDGGIYRQYIRKLAVFACEAIRAGRRIRLVIGEITDEQAVTDLRAALAGMGGEAMLRATEYAPVRDIHDVIRQMSGAEVAVATRFHNVVAALMAGTPVISLSYGAKNDILLRDMGLGAFSTHAETFDPAWLSERVEALAIERACHVAEIRRRVTAYRKDLAEQADVLCALMARCGDHPAWQDTAERMA